MSSETSPTNDEAAGRASRWITPRVWPLLVALTFVAAMHYSALLQVGPQHSLKIDGKERPILLVIGIYLSAFVAYWLAWWVATHAKADRRLLVWVLGTSLAWRLLLLPTPPFQEIDIYRYLWDGAVTSRGWDPYQYSPQQVVDAIDYRARGGEVVDPSGPLAAMVAFATQQAPEYETVLRTIHYGDLPSPYPPVSQAVFAAAASTSPFTANPKDLPQTATLQLKWLKLWLTMFDAATLLVVLWMLRACGKHPGHAVAYGWCPLVMKEIAGSGHLDSIATFFVVFALALTIRGLSLTGPLPRWGAVAAGAAALALGVGAKLFPIVLAPLLVLVWLRRLGVAHGLIGAAVLGLVTLLSLGPMLADDQTSDPPAQPQAAGDDARPLPPPPDGPPPAPVAKTDGLAAFLSRWEINDLAFLVVVENLRPQQETTPRYRPWFVITPDNWSVGAVESWRAAAARACAALDSWSGGAVSQKFGDPSDWPPSTASFLLARFLTLLVCGVLTLGFAWRASRRDAVEADVLRAAFLTLAWFWLLAPTQNPWYWCWAVPLLPFARAKAWSLLAACAMLYYVRFWLLYHFTTPGVFGTPYDGKFFFFFVIPWIEFGPWFLLLVVETVRRLSARRVVVS